MQTSKDAKNEKYLQFWKVFGKNIKLGVIEDSSNRTKLSKVCAFVPRTHSCSPTPVHVRPPLSLVHCLGSHACVWLQLLRFQSSKSGDDWVSLDEYVSRMKDYQKTIFYIAGENLDSVKKSMFLEKFKAKDVEVLFLPDPIDEYAIQNLSGALSLLSAVDL